MKISAVITSRNDNYGGHLSHRARICLTNFIERYDEVIYVDWNSKTNSLIEDIKLSLPQKNKLKHVLVTPYDVKQLNEIYESIDIVEVVGRNIGIRLSECDFIVSTNIDIIADKPDLKSLDKDTLYTVPRRDVQVSEFLNVNNDIEFGNSLILNQNNYPEKPDANRKEDIGDPWSLVICCGDYQVAHRDLWHKMRGFEESMIYRNFADTNLMKKGSIYGKISKLKLPIFHLNHSGHGDGTGGVTISNDKSKYVQNFTHTENSEDWGFYKNKFKIEII
jgi:hypothetical protein